MGATRALLASVWWCSGMGCAPSCQQHAHLCTGQGSGHVLRQYQPAIVGQHAQKRIQHDGADAITLVGCGYSTPPCPATAPHKQHHTAKGMHTKPTCLKTGWQCLIMMHPVFNVCGVEATQNASQRMYLGYIHGLMCKTSCTTCNSKCNMAVDNEHPPTTSIAAPQGRHGLCNMPCIVYLPCRMP